jgi:hypothetical protein
MRVLQLDSKNWQDWRKSLKASKRCQQFGAKRSELSQDLREVSLSASSISSRYEFKASTNRLKWFNFASLSIYIAQFSLFLISVIDYNLEFSIF